MKRLIAILALFLSAPLLFAADLTGIWVSSAKQPDGHTSSLALVLSKPATSSPGKIELPGATSTSSKAQSKATVSPSPRRPATGSPLTCDGTLEGGKLHLTVHENNDKPYDVVAARTKTDPFVIADVISPPAGYRYIRPMV